MAPRNTFLPHFATVGMIDRETYAGRVERLAGKGPFLASKPENMVYLSGTDAGFMMLVTGEGDALLLVSRMEAERAGRESWVSEMIAFQRGKVPLRDGEMCRFGSAAMVLGEVLEERGIDGLRHDGLPGKVASELSSVKLESSSEIEEMRAIKTPAEIELIEEARRVIGDVYEEVSSELAGDMSELAVAGMIVSSIMSRDVESSFDPIVAFDENSALPHGKPGRKRLSGARTMLFDIGAKVEGYCSDITRTVVETPRAMEELEVVKGAIEDVADALEVGMRLEDADAVARESLGDNATLMIHGLGHGLGLAVHEGPVLAAGSEDVLRDGMVFTIEPGIYHAGKYGIRWEDDYLCRNGRVGPVL
ncbi:MAG: aminopeptidase P family protein [Theionarchaea archaeon]|nr:aminopeptidase P family protein [Theionarchaea archaeon]